MLGTNVIYLVAAAIFTAPIAYGLQCYTCLTPTTALQCTAIQNCTEDEVWCFTTVYGPAGYPFDHNRVVVRGCAEYCAASNPNNLGVTRPTICCQSDLCDALNKVSGAIVTWETIVIGISASTVLQNWV
ncbi:secreted Ly-6/uPAR-related protein 1-like [Dendropsophus ebraccatus]|uniref:secreted Ly-6/uPAR-related protein 1-like n=1 Tax=Dendropsophus ebraccatus TaxID=150705 RepID=UPI0038322A4A